MQAPCTQKTVAPLTTSRCHPLFGSSGSELKAGLSKLKMKDLARRSKSLEIFRSRLDAEGEAANPSSLSAEEVGLIMPPLVP